MLCQFDNQQGRIAIISTEFILRVCESQIMLLSFSDFLSHTLTQCHWEKNTDNCAAYQAIGGGHYGDPLCYREMSFLYLRTQSSRREEVWIANFKIKLRLPHVFARHWRQYRLGTVYNRYVSTRQTRIQTHWIRTESATSHTCADYPMDASWESLKQLVSVYSQMLYWFKRLTMRALMPYSEPSEQPGQWRSSAKRKVQQSCSNPSHFGAHLPVGSNQKSFTLETISSPFAWRLLREQVHLRTACSRRTSSEEQVTCYRFNLWTDLRAALESTESSEDDLAGASFAAEPLSFSLSPSSAGGEQRLSATPFVSREIRLSFWITTSDSWYLHHFRRITFLKENCKAMATIWK